MAVILIFVVLHAMCSFALAAFKIFSLFIIFSSFVHLGIWDNFFSGSLFCVCLPWCSLNFWICDLVSLILENSQLFFCFVWIFWSMILGLGGENGNPLQYSCPENPMHRGTWLATIHEVEQSWAQRK